MICMRATKARGPAHRGRERWSHLLFVGSVLPLPLPFLNMAKTNCLLYFYFKRTSIIAWIEWLCPRTGNQKTARKMYKRLSIQTVSMYINSVIRFEQFPSVTQRCVHISRSYFWFLSVRYNDSKPIRTMKYNKNIWRDTQHPQQQQQREKSAMSMLHIELKLNRRVIDVYAAGRSVLDFDFSRRNG